MLGEDEDVWGTIMLEAMWGGIRLDVVSSSDASPNAIARHRAAYRRGADLEHTGRDARITRCVILFFERRLGPDEPPMNHYERFREFHNLKETGRTYPFVHPLTGTYKAKIGDYGWDTSATERDLIRVNCEFIEDTLTPDAFRAGAGTPVLAGSAEVSALRASVLAANDLVFPPDADDVQQLTASTVLDDAIAATESWEEDATTTARQVNQDLVALTNRIDTLAEELELAADVSRHPLAVALTRFRYSLLKAAQTFSQRTPRIIEIRVNAPAPLLVIAARTYGADQAEARRDELMRLNEIPNPARIEKGTVLRAHSPSSRVRLRAPRSPA